MIFTRFCKNCGIEFDAKHPNSQYCSAECRRVPEREYARMWRDKNREKYRAYMREYMRTGIVHTGD